MASLEAILKTQTIKVPKPIKVIDLSGGSTLFVMEHLDMRGLNRYITVLSLHSLTRNFEYYGNQVTCFQKEKLVLIFFLKQVKLHSEKLYSRELSNVLHNALLSKLVMHEEVSLGFVQFWFCLGFFVCFFFR